MIDEEAQRNKGGALPHYRYNPNAANSGNFTYVSTIFEDRQGLLWISFVTGGLLIFDPAKATFREIPLTDGGSSGSSRVAVQSIIEDDSGVLWFATNGLGVARHDNARKPFKIFQHARKKPNTLVGNEVTAVYEDRRGIWWIGTTLGLSRLEPNTGKIRNFQHVINDPHSLSLNNVQSVFEDSRNHLWIGTWGGGLNKLDRTTWQFTHYKHQASDSKSLSNNFIHAIYEDRSGNLWIGTGAGGLDKFDRDNHIFVHYSADAKRSEWLKSNEIHCIYEDPTGLLWLGTTMWGLYRFDPKQERFVNYMHELDNPQSLSSNRVISIYEDKLQRLWVGTFGGGLNRFDREKSTFFHFAEKDGLPNNSIHTILEDEHGNLWLSTNKGLSRFDPETKSFRNFYTNDGLPSNKFSFAAYRCRDNTMLFGSDKGLLYFFPDSIKDNPFIPPVVLTDFKILNQSVPIAVGNRKVDGKFALEKSISETERIELLYSQNVFTFEFAALHYAASFKNQYAYKMEGFDRDWIYAGKRRFATYTNLDPGNYIFHVKGSNSDGVWNEKGASIHITILPPWWKTTGAYIGYAVLLFVLLFFVRRFEMNRIKIRNRLRLRELEAQKLQEVDSLKSRFFANISHEFRTPLTLILGPLEDMMSKTKDKLARDNLRMMQRNASRVLQLINQLLDLSRLESGRMKLNASRGDLIPFLRGIVMSFASGAERKQIGLSFEPREGSEPSQGFYFDRDKIEKIFYNLLSNALKFTPAGGRVEVMVKTVQLPGPGTKSQITAPKASAAQPMVEIVVKDSGIGIAAERLPHIFDRFYQVDSTSTREHEGSGIGLALTKELVELHRGEIEVHSEEGKGTKFVVRLPLGKAHLKEDQIVAEPPVSGVLETAVPPAEVSSPLPSEMAKPGIMRHEDTIILVVEDHEDVRCYVREHIEPVYKVIEAADGEAGASVALETIPDLVISDVMMPKLDGYQLCEKLKTDEKTSHIPVILLTAKAGEEDKLSGLETGADDYLTKPFNSKELQVRVQNLIEQRRKLRARFRREGILQPRDIAVPSVEEAFLHKLMDIMEAELGDEDFGVEKLSAALRMGRRQLLRKIRSLTGQSPVEFIRSVRLQRAKQLLEKHAGTVSEIAFQVGFANLSHFTRRFREEFGVLPSEVARK